MKQTTFYASINKMSIFVGLISQINIQIWI